MPTLDELDVALLDQLLTRPRAGMREYARTLDVARGTVHARLGRMERSGVISDYAPRLSAPRLGLPVLAFLHLHLAQGKLGQVTRSLVLVDEVVEAHTIAGEGDILVRVVARDTEHLEAVIQRFLQMPGVVRTRTEIALTERVAPRSRPLLDLALRASGPEELPPVADRANSA